MKKVVGWLLVLAFFFMQSGRARAILICDGEAYVVVAEHNGAHKGMAAVADDNRNGLKYGDMNKLLLSDGSYASVNASFRWTCQVCSDGGFNLVSESGKYLIPAVSSSGKPGLLLDSSQSSVSYWRECENGIEGHSAWYDGNCRLVYVSDGYFTAVPEDDLAESYWQNVKLAPLSVARDSVIMEGGVKVLSGGERTRLAMLRLLLEPVNLLILDEPTNHLDLKTKDILKQALLDFDGTLIVVSHDRDFLDGLVSKVYEFGNQRVTEHLEGIYEFMQRKKMENLRELERSQNK